MEVFTSHLLEYLAEKEGSPTLDALPADTL